MRVALGLLETRARSRAELASALRRRNVPDELADQVLARLGELGYVDDAGLALALAVTKVQVARRGRGRIRRELRARGLSDEVVAEAVSAIAPDDEWAAARALATRKAGTMGRLDPPVALRRLQAMLARRGFGPEICLAVAREAITGAPETLERFP